MAEGNKNTTLCKGVERESNLNVTQDSLISTNINESVNNIADELTIETVDDKSSKSHDVDVFNQLALMMEIINNKFEQQNKNNDKLNTNLSDFKSAMKAEINVVNNKLDKQDKKMKSESNNLKSEIK